MITAIYKELNNANLPHTESCRNQRVGMGFCYIKEGDMNKSYYAIIPANVRYDTELNPNSKLLYGEITALCNEEGCCWATNDYFAELYNVSKISISKWINLLVQKGYLISDIIYKEGTKQILNRYLRIVEYPIKEKFNTPIKEKFKENNTSMNNTSEYKETITNVIAKKEKFVPPIFEEVLAYAISRGREDLAKKFYDYYSVGNWKDREDKKVKNWKQKFITWEDRNPKPENTINDIYEKYPKLKDLED